jgi:hypothetical protein
MAIDGAAQGWGRDERGDLYRLLTASEREQVLAAREEGDVDADASPLSDTEAEPVA